MRLRLEHALLESGVQPDVLVEVEDGRIKSVGDPAASRRRPRPHHPGPRQLPLARVPPGAAGADPDRAGVLLDLARADVRRGRGAHAGHVLRAGPRHLRRDARDRHQRGRRVPLPAPPARRDAVRRPQRDGQGAPGCCRRGGDPDPPARHLLPRGGYRPAAGGGAGALLRRRRRRVGGAGGCVRRPSGRCRDPLGPCRPAGPAEGGGRGRGGKAPPCPCLRAGGGERGVPGGVRRHTDPAARRGRSARAADHRRARDPPERRRHPAAGGVTAPTSASARPPSATSPTGSGRRGCCTTPAPP